MSDLATLRQEHEVYEPTPHDQVEMVTQDLMGAAFRLQRWEIISPGITDSEKAGIEQAIKTLQKVIA